MIFRILVKMQDTIKHYKTFSHSLIFFPLPFPYRLMQVVSRQNIPRNILTEDKLKTKQNRSRSVVHTTLR